MSECNILSIANHQRILHCFLYNAYNFKEALRLDSLHFIKSCTNEKDSVFILFGGSGGEIMLCENLKRKWIACELHKPYYEMILDRLANNGRIKDEFKLNLSHKPNLDKKEASLFG